MASQLINDIKQIDSCNYGGCIVYDNSILCTHLDLLITRCILNRIDFMVIYLICLLK
jgi:hypothetical protein